MVALFVVLTFIIFLVADYFVLKARKKEHPAFASRPVFDKNSIFFPLSYLISSGHVWLAAVKENLYRVGIDEFILKAFGSVKIQDVVSSGTNVKKGDVLFTGVSGNKSFAFRSPVNGVVCDVNTKALQRNLDDIYNTDWALTIQPEGNIAESLKSNKAASHWLQEEFRKFKDFLTAQTADPALVGLTMADGGHINEGAAHHLPQEAVTKFEQLFLMQ